MGGNIIYFNYAGKLLEWRPEYGNGNKVEIGKFWYPNPSPSNPNRTTNQAGFQDIAVDADGKMYGVSSAQDGSFWAIDRATAQVTYISSSFLDLATSSQHDIGDKINALANAGLGRFFAAMDGGGITGAIDNGHLYELFWDGTTLSGHDRGGYNPNTTDPVSAALFGNNYKITSVGDLWYWNDTLYATVRAYDTFQEGEARFMLATVDPLTAMCTAVANLDPWSDGTVVVDGVRQPKYDEGNRPTGNQYEALVNHGPYVGLLRNDGYLMYWDGTVVLDGTNVHWTGIDVGCNDILGATVVTPAPGAVALGMLGLGMVGAWMRKKTV
ncbi:MAG: hypothetical protein GX591_18850 [Planctomycetes bacterium]|nr:hypothetical protein [Planctomycetota bacterium]